MSDPYENPEDRYTYRCELVDQLRSAGSMQVGRLKLVLPEKFGFCWGVDRALAMVQDARAAYPGRPMWLLNSIIHNPRVNADMTAMGVGFLKGPTAAEGALESLGPEDVVIVPAFSAEVEELEHLHRHGVQVVDTTCPWVIKPHKRALRYIKEGFTTIIHGTVGHDETRSTCSLVRHHHGQYLVVHDLAETEVLVRYLQREIGGEELLAGLHAKAVEPDFDPRIHLQRIGIINQTTMLASESRAIADRLRRALESARGAGALEASFRDFDTICAATQENQDAAMAVASGHPHLFIVVGGHDSSNTRNLARVGDGSEIPAYHVESPEAVKPDRLLHLNRDGEVRVERDWLPLGQASVAFTAGASTPDAVLGEVIERVVAAAGESMPRKSSSSSV